MSIHQDILHSCQQLLALNTLQSKEKKWMLSQNENTAHLNTAHFHILSYLLKHPSATAKQVSNRLDILPGTLSKWMTQLQRRGLILTTADPKDSRSKHYSLSPLGTQLAALYDAMNQQKNAQLKRILEEFDPEQLQTIAKFLSLVGAVEGNMTYHRVKETQT